MSASEPLPDTSEDPRRNDEFAWIDEMSDELLAASATLVNRREQSRVSDRSVAQILTAAIRLYAAKTDLEERTFRPLYGQGDDELSATELLTAVSELLRAMNLSPMELAIWYRHRPDPEGEPK